MLAIYDLSAIFPTGFFYNYFEVTVILDNFFKSDLTLRNFEFLKIIFSEH